MDFIYSTFHFWCFLFWQGISSAHLLSRVQLFATPWTAARQASLSITNSWSLPKVMSIESVTSSSVVHFASCLQSYPASGSFPMSQLFAWGGQNIGVSALASVLPGLISFRMDWLDLLAVQGTLKSLLQHHSSKASFFGNQPYHPSSHRREKSWPYSFPHTKSQ